MTKTQQIKLDILNNFIDWFTSDEEGREILKESAHTYVGEDHVDELAQDETVHVPTDARVSSLTMSGLSNWYASMAWAKSLGFANVEKMDTSSSAGDWAFIVSEDGDEWYIMTQENNWPKGGFTASIDLTESWYGTPETVMAEIQEINKW